MQSELLFQKSHKQIKKLVKDLSFTMKKVKYLEHEEQISEVQSALDKVWRVPHFFDRNSVIDFLTQDYIIVKAEAEPESTQINVITKGRRRGDYMEGFDAEQIMSFG